MTNREHTASAASEAAHLVDIATEVQRFQRMRSGKAAHAALTAAADVDITQQSLQLLLAVDDGTSPSELARSLNMDTAAVSRELRRMETDGLIARRPSTSRAGVAVSLTRDGTGARDRIVAVRTEHLARALADWSGDTAQTFARLLGRFVDDLQATPLGD